MSKTKGNYTRIHNYMITELGLNGTELLIYAYIHGFSQNKQECFTTQCRMAQLFNIDRTTAFRALHNLHAKSLITITKTAYKITYAATAVKNSYDFFDVFDNMLDCNLNVYELITYAYARKNLGKNISAIATALHVHRNTVSKVLNKLQELKLFVLESCRHINGKFKGVYCRLTGYKPQNVADNIKNSSIKQSNTNNSNSKSTNKFNQFEQRSYDYDELEKSLLANQ